ncbi:hypothetical protein BX616_004521 [Lobosporangium transversale]|uniref:Uncharacterized protein n=1 Tax=Lobosporangium transversale TaxID=64571 RepID=A0A1Y2GI31_9FUNG|nr:hypothetical protein BCR41DRAFT_423600 [Lobosporangium transversale]KAF9916139.1 hypothetical protein BX616_004521 [Lobosporangium transversale]ORZ11397.1 hypothetical protein BCR41DRAFT_423600 [Lobosporangium transversale]|eukprot:XP_021879712.1 hypothetical protein BCR41DRAFT_423600 [Lobosporangium transversale]
MADILPQLIDFATQLDLQRLIVAQTIVCLLAAIRSVPVYNLPLLFFGLYAYEHHESAEPLQQFAGFTAFSILLDIVWCLLSPGIGFGEGLTIVVLLFKPFTIISALQLLKYRGDPFSILGGGGWSSRGHGLGNGGFGAYQSLGDPLDDERDAEEISIPRHHSGNSHNSHSGSSHLFQHHQGRHRYSQQSSSFMTSSSRSASVKSSKTGSGYNVELGHGPSHNLSNTSSIINTNTNTNTSNNNNSGNSINQSSMTAAGQHSSGKAVSVASSNARDDRRDKVGQVFSEDEDDDTSSRENLTHSSSENTRLGH